MNKMVKRLMVLAMLVALCVLPAAAFAQGGTIKGTGTEAEPFLIEDLADLKAFRDDVNSGKTYAKKYVKLDANINLNNEEWTPIGNSTNKFQGNFDGGNHTISNLSITGNKRNVGFFGYTTNGEIKNLTIKNAKVSGYLEVGVVAGTPYTSKYTNISVTGHVEVNGYAYVGGVGGKNAYADWTNITVNVDSSSYVKADSENYRTYVGGVIGFMGEGGHTFKNISSNIDVTGSTCDIGGIAGIAHYGNKFINVSCSGDVTTLTDDLENAGETGGIAGVWHNGGADVTFENCTFTGKLNQPVGAKQYNGGLVGPAYSASGNGNGTLNGEPIDDDFVIVTQSAAAPVPGTAAPSTGSLPKTGDESNLMLFATLLAMSAAGMLLLRRRSANR